MTATELYHELREKFAAIIEEHGIASSEVTIKARALSAQEAIGDTQRKDFPILEGKEILMMAEYQSAFGQAFTSTPADFSGTLSQILSIDLVNDDHGRALFVATMNAVLRKLGLADHTVHCKDDEPEQCALDMVGQLRESYGQPKIALVGYQPAMIEALSGPFELEVLDLNPANVGQTRYGVEIKHGIDDFKQVTDWADLILCTGSTLCNGTIADYISLDKEVVYFGTTVAGAAALLGLKRLCFCSK